MAERRLNKSLIELSSHIFLCSFLLLFQEASDIKIFIFAGTNSEP